MNQIKIGSKRLQLSISSSVESFLNIIPMRGICRTQRKRIMFIFKRYSLRSTEDKNISLCPPEVYIVSTYVIINNVSTYCFLATAVLCSVHLDYYQGLFTIQ